jgi:hypothetical protein
MSFKKYKINPDTCVRMNFTMPPRVGDLIRGCAKSMQTTLSDVVRQAVEDFAAKKGVK